jgi:hypothetical protein
MITAGDELAQDPELMPDGVPDIETLSEGTLQDDLGEIVSEETDIVSEESEVNSEI